MIQIKTTWQKPTQEFKNLFNDVRYRAENIYNIEIPTCYISNKMGGHKLGCYTFEWSGYNKKDISITDDIILFNKVMYKLKEHQQLETIVHEIAHCVANKYYECDCYHNYKWEQIAREIASHYGVNVSMRIEDKEVLEVMKNNTTQKVYSCVCQGCGQVIKRHRIDVIDRIVNRCTCGRCHSKFKRT